ncbi:hypothetical protein [Candidatus Contendibacter odensensis]|uniref:Uncharacterized protein n=1 Tax=Candidatus Contendobacter odensis Run_B_J11 TaxID=1400861 RepID=A0A7U7J591_9GAMM|nr:hypothetical protein [Candidatus Contendobacter odensis]CDH46985.1 hypothetical protein BN874_690035 [Candidatus Contendobacter odensis Run_B_J11]
MAHFNRNQNEIREWNPPADPAGRRAWIAARYTKAPQVSDRTDRVIAVLLMALIFGCFASVAYGIGGLIKEFIG